MTGSPGGRAGLSEDGREASAVSLKYALLVGARGAIPKAAGRAVGGGSGRRHPSPKALTVPWPDGHPQSGNLPLNGAASRCSDSGTPPEQDRPIPPQAGCRRGPAPEGGSAGSEPYYELLTQDTRTSGCTS